VLAHHELAKSANFADLSLPVSGLYLLAAPSTPAKLPRRLDACARGSGHREAQRNL
jgi:hypothetical protein